MVVEVEGETAYLLNRLVLMEESQDSEKINIEELTHSAEDVYLRLCERIKETTIHIKKNAKGDRLQLEYDSRQ